MQNDLNQLKNPNQANKKKLGIKRIAIFILIGIVALLVFCVLFGFIGNAFEGFSSVTQATQEETVSGTDQTTTPAEASNQTTLPTPEQTLNPSATFSQTLDISELSFQQIIDSHNQLTDAQWNDFTKKIKGSRVRWTGNVDNVNVILGSYSVFVCMGESDCADNVMFNVTQEMGEKLQKQQQITFEGEVGNITNILGITIYLENVNIISQ